MPLHHVSGDSLYNAPVFEKSSSSFWNVRLGDVILLSPKE